MTRASSELSLPVCELQVCQYPNERTDHGGFFLPRQPGRFLTQAHSVGHWIP